MENQGTIITFSKTRTIINCCIVTLVIAATISLIGKIDIHQFWMNIKDWQNM